jgi:hypothetical protein
MRRNLSTKVVDRLILVVHGRHDPTDEEWAQHLAILERHGIESTRMLVHMQGGAPTRPRRTIRPSCQDRQHRRFGRRLVLATNLFLEVIARLPRSGRPRLAPGSDFGLRVRCEALAGPVIKARRTPQIGL